MKNIKDHFIAGILFIIGITSRIPFLEKYQSHWDGPDYTIGILHYSLAQNTPSPPGYPLYIFLGSLFHYGVLDPHLAILCVSVLFAGIGSVVYYFAGKIIFNKTVGLIASILFLTSPVVYYFGITANPYGILPATAALLGLTVFLITVKKKQYGFFLGLIFSFSVGIRPQDALFLFPLFLFGLYGLTVKEKLISVATLLVSFLIWFLPTAFLVGGIQSYLFYVVAFSKTATQIQSPLIRISEIWLIIAKGMFLTLGIAGVFLLYYIRTLLQFVLRKKRNLKREELLPILFFVIWFFPSFLFNLFVRSDHAAHQMTYLAVLILLAANGIWQISKKYPRVLILLLIGITCFNLFTFLRSRPSQDYLPYVSQSYHYSEIVKNNIRMDSYIAYIANNYHYSQTIIIVDPEIFRQISYYFKNYYVYSYSVLDTNAPSIKDTFHMSYNWDYHFSYNPEHIIRIPKDIKYIIVVTNNKGYTIAADNVKEIRLGGNSFIYTIDTNPQSEYILSFHTITKTK